MKKTIIIKTDGSNKIGLGHIYRSINLAKELKKNNFRIVFLTNSIIVKKIVPKSFIVINYKNDLNELIKILDEFKPKIIVIDKLEENKKELKIMIEKTIIFTIDYIGKNKNFVKKGINILYQISGSQKKNSFSGFKFAILNDSIKNKQPIEISKKVKKILIIQGGSDTPCNTPIIIDSLNQINEKLLINVIVGASFQCWKELDDSITHSSHKIKLHNNIKNIGKIMKLNDLAITGGGITCLELCHLGIPSVLICGAPFENETTSLLEKKGFGVNLGYRKKISRKKIVNATKNLMTDYNQRKKMNKVGKKLIDGNGTLRVSNEILRLIK